MRKLLLITALACLAAACDKTINEVRTPVQNPPLVADAR